LIFFIFSGNQINEMKHSGIAASQYR